MKKVIACVNALFVVALLVGCTTGDRTLETPPGERSAESVGGPLIILGIVSKNTSTKSQPNASHFFEETVKVNVPPGTVAIVPAMRGWTFGYGGTVPEDLSAQPDPNGTTGWRPEDHNLGISSINVFVEDIDAVDPSTNTQTATIHITAILSDDNGDDSWFGDVNYTLLCLGRSQSGLSATAAAAAAGVGSGNR